MKQVLLLAALAASAPLSAQGPATPPSGAQVPPQGSPGTAAIGAPVHAPMPKGPITFVSAAEVEAFVTDARKTIRPGQPGIFKAALVLAPYMGALEYRVATSYANVHPTEAELIYVISGSGTIVTGGTVVDPKARPDGNINGSGITGGTPRHLAPGDIMIVPEGVPHIFNQFDGALVMVTMKVPRTPPAP